MKSIKELFDRWKSDYDFKTLAGALGALSLTGLFALYNGYLGIRYRSLWYGTICIYYLILVLLRGLIVAAARKVPASSDTGTVKQRRRVYVVLAGLFLILNISLVVPVSLMVMQQKPVSFTLIPAITMAAYTTYKITMAAINLKRRKRASDDFIKLLRIVNFIDALVSILTLQNTLIMVNSGGESMEMLPLTAFTSAAILVVILGISAFALVRGIRNLRAENGPAAVPQQEPQVQPPQAHL